MADDDEQFRTIKMGLLDVCSDRRVFNNLNDVAIRASEIGYLATTYLRHDVYDAIINDRQEVLNRLLPVTERSLVPYWNEVSSS